MIPTPYEIPVTLADCQLAREKIDRLMKSLGLRRHPEKGEWTGSQVLEHLGVMIDTVALNFYVVPHAISSLYRTRLPACGKWLGTC